MKRHRGRSRAATGKSNGQPSRRVRPSRGGAQSHRSPPDRKVSTSLTWTLQSQKLLRPSTFDSSASRVARPLPSRSGGSLFENSAPARERSTALHEEEAAPDTGTVPPLISYIHPIVLKENILLLDFVNKLAEYVTGEEDLPEPDACQDCERA